MREDYGKTRVDKEERKRGSRGQTLTREVRRTDKTRLQAGETEGERKDGQRAKEKDGESWHGRGWGT